MVAMGRDLLTLASNHDEWVRRVNCFEGSRGCGGSSGARLFLPIMTARRVPENSLGMMRKGLLKKFNGGQDDDKFVSEYSVLLARSVLSYSSFS
jgi:hypothetical protein